MTLSDSMVTSVTLTKHQQTALVTLIEAIPQIISQLTNPQYDEIFGYRINLDHEPYVNIAIRNEILLKFLIANDYDVDITITKLVETINWRYTFQPLSAAYNEKFTDELNQLGVITYLPEEKVPNYKVGTWNLYGNMKSPKQLFQQFGDASDKKLGSVFLRWRIGLMEKSLLLVDFTDKDNHKIVQVHDYKGVSMFSPDKNMRQATKEIIKIFGDNYPELLSTKFFINVPSLMSWVFKLFTTIGVINKETLDKFRPLNHGDLSPWFDKSVLPETYGGINPKLIFDLDKVQLATIPEYGKVILEKLNSSFVHDVTLSVD